jgi:galactokinase
MKKEMVKQRFKEIYKSEPDGIASSPGRVNLIGEHTDYNDGFVLPCALGFSTQAVFQSRPDKLFSVTSLDYDNQQETFSVDQTVSIGKYQWANYVKGVVYAFQSRGLTVKGANLVVTGDVPQGAGLSSSAALELAIAGALNHMNNHNLSQQELALIGQQAENEFMNCQCGIMDQLISALGTKGHALLIDCLDLSTAQIAIPADLDIVIINSNVKRELVDSEYNQRRIECEDAAKVLGVSSLRSADLDMLLSIKKQLPEKTYRRAHHVITENKRTQQAADALKNNDFPLIRKLMLASHQSLHTDFEVTVPATHALVEMVMQAAGDNGAARMTGGGFGGAIVALLKTEVTGKVIKHVRHEYPQQFGLEPDVFVCKASHGLKVDTYVNVTPIR